VFLNEEKIFCKIVYYTLYLTSPYVLGEGFKALFRDFFLIIHKIIKL